MMIAITETFETDRLTSWRMTPADGRALFLVCSDPEVTRYVQWRTHQTVIDTKRFVRSANAAWDAGNWFCWGVRPKGETSTIGCVDCRIVDEGLTFGYALKRAAWGRGYATEVVRALIANLRIIYGSPPLWATCAVENAASIRVLIKCGLSCLGLMRASRVYPNLSALPRDALLFRREA